LTRQTFLLIDANKIIYMIYVTLAVHRWSWMTHV